MSDRIREDKQALKQLFEDLGNQCATVLPDGWQRAIVGAFCLEGGSPTVVLYYRSSEDEDYVDGYQRTVEKGEGMRKFMKLSRAVNAIHRHCAGSGDNWAQMTFALDAGGHFEADFGYEPVATLSDGTLMRWQARHFD